MTAAPRDRIDEREELVRQVGGDLAPPDVQPSSDQHIDDFSDAGSRIGRSALRGIHICRNLDRHDLPVAHRDTCSRCLTLCCHQQHWILACCNRNHGARPQTLSLLDKFVKELLKNFLVNTSRAHEGVVCSIYATSTHSGSAGAANAPADMPAFDHDRGVMPWNASLFGIAS